MMPDDIITRDSEGQLAVNTVSSTEANVPYNYDDCFTIDTNGRRALRVVGAGGGGSVDYTKVVSKTKTMPVAGADNANMIYLYDGSTNATYTHGYVYENKKTATYTGTVSFEAATLSGTTVACSGDDFAAFLTEAGADPTPIVSGTMTYEADATGWRLVGKDADNNTVTSFLEYNEDYADAGFTFTGTPEDGDVIAFTCEITEASASYAWERIDVQPAGDSTQVVEKGSGAITQELAGDTVYNCGTVSALTITFPATVTPKYISQVNFTSGTTATALTAPVGMVWLGNDIVQGVFVPVASKRYAVLFFYDGTNVRGLVQGA